MSTAQKRPLSAGEYLALESTADVRHEFHDGEMFAMGGGTLWHKLIKDNLPTRSAIESKAAGAVWLRATSGSK